MKRKKTDQTKGKTGKSRAKKGAVMIAIAAIAAVVLLALFWAIAPAAMRRSVRSGVMTLEEGEKSEFRPDAILVLGAGVRGDGTPSMMLEDRLLTCLRLYEAGVASRIIVSGDHGSDNYDEVNVMKDYLKARGVPGEAIFMDHAGFCTYDSLYRAGAVFGAKSLLIVTQEYHAYRAVYDGERLGVECRAVAAPILASDASGYARQWYYDLRETVASCKDIIWCFFRFPPKFLGDPVSLEASGDLTNDKDPPETRV